MAAARSEDQRRDIAAFVQWLYETSSCASWAEFAERAGVHPVQVSEWQLGKVVPDGHNLIRLIRAAGVLRPTDLSTWATDAETARLIHEVHSAAQTLATLLGKLLLARPRGSPSLEQLRQPPLREEEGPASPAADR